MSDRKVIHTFKFNYTNITINTICGNTFNIKQVGSITTSDKNSEIWVKVDNKSYQINQRTHEYILNFLYPISSNRVTNE